MTKIFNEENIRVAAYYLWEKAGRPEGMEKEFWNQACDQLMHLNSCNNLNKKSLSVKSNSSKSSLKKSTVKASVQKTSIKPTVIAKPFYGTKK